MKTPSPAKPDGGLQPRGCLADHVAAIAQRSPHSLAVVFGDLRWTYAELHDRVCVVANALQLRGFQSGQCLATLSTPRPEFLVLFLAVGRLGGLWMGLNPRHRPQELEWVISDARPTVLTVLATLDRELVSSATEAARQLPACSVLEFGTDLGTDTLDGLGVVLPTDSHAQTLPECPPPESPALLVYTSGSTGRPKGALISHYGLTFGSLVQAHALGLERHSMVCNLPISHVGCVADICSVVLVQGGTLVFQERFDVEAMFEAIERERVTVWGGVPSMFQMMIEHQRFAHADLSSVKLVLWGGAAMPRPVIDTLRGLGLGLRLKGAYGMTETSCHVAFTPDDAAPEVLAGTVGRPTEFTPCRIVDEGGSACEVGETGELQVYGRQNFLGYLRQPEATAGAFTVDGWLRTGDVAEWTAGGDIRLVGRLHDIVKSGGYSVYPREIECVLESHPAVAACAVVGTPDPLFQEVCIAFVSVHQGETLTPGQLEAFLRQHLANYKVPKSIVLVDALPLLPIGKVDKSALRSRAATLHSQSRGA